MLNNVSCKAPKSLLSCEKDDTRNKKIDTALIKMIQSICQLQIVYNSDDQASISKLTTNCYQF